jgi:hypothetical protein
VGNEKKKEKKKGDRDISYSGDTVVSKENQ